VRQYRVDAANAVHNLDDPQIDEEACERESGIFFMILQRSRVGGFLMLYRSAA